MINPAAAAVNASARRRLTRERPVPQENRAVPEPARKPPTLTSQGWLTSTRGTPALRVDATDLTSRATAWLSVNATTGAFIRLLLDDRGHATGAGTWRQSAAGPGAT